MKPITIKLNGASVKVDLTTIGVCPIDDLPEQLARWKTQAALARHELARVDAEYREFRARETMAVLTTEPKISEWKLKARIEASPDFLVWKQGAAQAAVNVELCEAMAAGYRAAVELADVEVAE